MNEEVVRLLNIDAIFIPNLRIRSKSESKEEKELLEKSISEGMIYPIVVGEFSDEARKEFEEVFKEKIPEGKYVLIDGETRLNVYKREGKKEIPAKIYKINNLDEYFIIHITLNPKRIRENYKEVVAAYAERLIEKGWTKSRIIRHLSKVFKVTDKTIYNWLVELGVFEKGEISVQDKERKEEKLPEFTYITTGEKSTGIENISIQEEKREKVTTGTDSRKPGLFEKTRTEEEETVREKIMKDALPLIKEDKSFKEIVRELTDKGYSKTTIEEVVKPMLDAKRKAAELLLAGKSPDFVIEKLTKQGYLRDYVESIVTDLHEKIIKELDVKTLLEQKIKEAEEKGEVLMKVYELQAILNYINEVEEVARKLQEELKKARKELEEYKSKIMKEVESVRKRVEKKATAAQIKFMNDLLRKVSEPVRERIIEEIKTRYGVTRLEDLTVKQASEVLDTLRNELSRVSYTIEESSLDEKIKTLAFLRGVSEEDIRMEILNKFGYYPDDFMPVHIRKRVERWLDEEISKLKSI